MRTPPLAPKALPMALSPRLRAVFDRLPLRPGMRVLEIGCGPGALARAIAAHGAAARVLGIDRSARAVAQALAASQAGVAAGRLAFQQARAEDFVLAPGEPPFDLIVAVRVGALDGRHPEAGRQAWTRIAAALAPGGRVFVDGQERPVRLPAIASTCRGRSHAGP
ncbi:MAG: methyltransferase domain-containing protein [Burkholderiales bacterium]|nr:methyltransferase domain-containing protein [Burkholderiales bacterium]